MSHVVTEADVKTLIGRDKLEDNRGTEECRSAYHHGHRPVMTVDDVGSLAKLQQEFECGTREIRKPLEVIGLVVDLLAVEEIIGVMCVNEVHPKSCALITTFGTHVSCNQSRLRSRERMPLRKVREFTLHNSSPNDVLVHSPIKIWVELLVQFLHNTLIQMPQHPFQTLHGQKITLNPALPSEVFRILQQTGRNCYKPWSFGHNWHPCICIWE